MSTIVSATLLSNHLGGDILRAVFVLALGEGLVMLCWLSFVPPVKLGSGGSIYASLVVAALTFYAVAGVMLATHGAPAHLSQRSVEHALAVVLQGANEPADEGSMRN